MPATKAAPKPVAKIKTAPQADDSLLGQKVPTFALPTGDGDNVNSKALLGKPYVLYFYPKDDTPSCTVQACNLRDNYSMLFKKGFQIIGISTDTTKSHQKFATKYQLPFPLIPDEDHAIAEKYGVWGLKKFMGREYIGMHRTTFLIDEKGKIKHVITKPITKKHAQQVLEAWSSE